MNVFTLHQKIIDDYREYIHSFVRIDNNRIRETVLQALNNRKLWKQPLIQFNPSFRVGKSIQELVNEGVLHPALSNVFKGYALYEHQVQAIRLGSAEEGFVVTSGTGSGKSLTFIGTIFNFIFQHQTTLQPGVKAIIIYPMNALINSQHIELEGYAAYYKSKTGREFPIKSEQYTGQESDEIRQRIQANPPDILLTNYMMLELLLTRHNDGEAKLRQSIYNNIRFLAYDELHTFRGRQGADVALLNRRLIGQAANPVTCIGTSATMVSGGTFAQQKQKIAQVASLFFGQTFKEHQIIRESLEYSIGQHVSFNPPLLKELIEGGLSQTDDIQVVQQSLLAAWLEKQIALKEQERRLVRNQPLTQTAIITELANYAGCSTEKAGVALETLLNSISLANVKAKENGQKAVLPFKLHQFISQTGSVYMTLDSEIITLEASPSVQTNTQRSKPLFSLVFSRESGVAFFCVNRLPDTLTPRDFDDLLADGFNEQSEQRGYVILCEPDHDDPDRDRVWNADDQENLPDAWVNRDSSDQVTSVVKKYRSHIPQKIYFDELGNWADAPDESKPIEGWFMPAKLLFDPTSGTFFDTQTKEGSKLTRLGSEGRSTSTTVLSFVLLKQMAQHGYADLQQKLLSFTDNRQDAALQAGHFNDFINIVQIRSAIYRAVKESADKELDYSQIATEVVKNLGLQQEEYADRPGSGIMPRKENERVLKDYLTYRILEDLRRSWRIVLPNAEQCGLLKIRYKYLEEQCAEEPFWAGVPLLGAMNAVERAECVFQLLDYFRKHYALYYLEYLTQDSMDTKRTQIIQKLKDPWCFDANEAPRRSKSLRLTALDDYPRSVGLTESIGYSSAFGRYVRKLFRKQGDPIKKQDYTEALTPLLNQLAEAGWLRISEFKGHSGLPLYQLNIDCLLWKLGDGQSVDLDLIKNPSYKPTDKQPNRFFQQVYQTDFRTVRKLSAREHTGQVGTEERIKREDDFREGRLNALYCSPTMELGIDISSLDIVHMRNVPPSPANYAQRSGRAGRSGQAALVFTYCGAYSPHDKHYYRNEIDMVAGVVSAPQLDLINQDLLRSHLYALCLATTGLDEVNRSATDLLDENMPDLPLNDTVRAKLNLSVARREQIRLLFEKVLTDDFRPKLSQKHWFTQDWIQVQLDQFAGAFDRAFDRWRKLYRDASRQLETSTQVIDSKLYKSTSTEFREAQREQRFAQQQIDLLRNNAHTPNSISEFYPYRYLASEGFLPGYNFTRLPLRAFLESSGKTGEFVSRPRALALREFGPRNVVYHSGNKYEIRRIRVLDLDNMLSKAKVSERTGYFLEGDDYNRDTCPFSGEPLMGDNLRRLYVDLLDMAETRAIQRDRITCEEEERVKQGYRIETFFSVPSGMDTVQVARLKTPQSDLLTIQYIPTAKLVHVNEGWRSEGRNGFRVNQFGEWLADNDDADTSKVVQLYTHTTADALYIQPVSALNLTANGVVTLQYALKRAIEVEFQIEPSELGVQLMGNADNPNIFLYESAEGSLGVLSQLVSDKEAFHKVVRKAYALCRFNEDDYKAPASYDDLLSYYNQRDHQRIDRMLIREGLEMMQDAEIELKKGKNYDNYDEQFRSLLNQYDKNSTLERKFLEYLYANNLRLPDKAQARVDNIYSQPDFFYEPDFHVFIDGSVHDRPDVKEHDRKVRKAITNQGEQCWVYRYDQDLAEHIAKRSDVFIKIR